MSLLQISVIVKLISSSFYLVSGMIWKKILSPDFKNYQLIFYRTLASIFFTTIVIFAFLILGFSDSLWLKPVSDIPYSDWLLCIVICMFSFWGLYYFTSALKTGRLSIVQSLTVTSSVFAFITAVIIYNETVSVYKWIAILFLGLGFLYHQSNNFRGVKITREILYVFLSSLVWGISFVLYLKPIETFGVLYFSLILEVCVLTSAWILILVNDKKIIPRRINVSLIKYCVLIGLMVVGGSIFSHLALTQIPVSINILVGLLFEVVVILYGITKLKETLIFRDWVLIFVVTACGILTMV